MLSFSPAGQKLPSYHSMAKQLFHHSRNGLHTTGDWASEQNKKKEISFILTSQNYSTTESLRNKSK